MVIILHDEDLAGVVAFYGHWPKKNGGKKEMGCG